MTIRNTRSGKLAFLLIALVILAVLQPVPAKTQDLEQLRKDAEQGDATAQYQLGFRYNIGQGAPQDDAEAVRWYRLAAEQGDVADAPIPPRWHVRRRRGRAPGTTSKPTSGLSGIGWLPSRASLMPNTASVACTPPAWACPRTTSKPTSGLTWQPHELQIKLRTTG